MDTASSVPFGAQDRCGGGTGSPLDWSSRQHWVDPLHPAAQRAGDQVALLREVPCARRAVPGRRRLPGERQRAPVRADRGQAAGGDQRRLAPGQRDRFHVVHAPVPPAEVDGLAVRGDRDLIADHHPRPASGLAPARRAGGPGRPRRSPHHRGGPGRGLADRVGARCGRRPSSGAVLCAALGLPPPPQAATRVSAAGTASTRSSFTSPPSRSTPQLDESTGAARGSRGGIPAASAWQVPWVTMPTYRGSLACRPPGVARGGRVAPGPVSRGRSPGVAAGGAA